MSTSNYRVTFGGEDIDYKSDFAKCREYYHVINSVLMWLHRNGVEHAWWFFEPYVEITWLYEHANYTDEVCKLIKRHLPDMEVQVFTPENGWFAEWFHATPQEAQFGAERYAATAELARKFYEHDHVFTDGPGREAQFVRTFHVLANQLAINYKEESKLLIKRGILAALFWFLGHKKAVWVYTKLLRQKYM